MRIVRVYWMFFAKCACVLDVLCGLCVRVGCFVRIVTGKKAKCVSVYWMTYADCACLSYVLCGFACIFDVSYRLCVCIVPIVRV